MTQVTVTTVRKNGVTTTLPNQRELRTHSSGVPVVHVKGGLYKAEPISPTEVRVNLDSGLVEAVSPSKKMFEAARATAPARSEKSKRGKAKPAAQKTKAAPEIDVEKVAAKVLEKLSAALGIKV